MEHQSQCSSAAMGPSDDGGIQLLFKEAPWFFFVNIKFPHAKFETMQFKSQNTVSI